MNILIIDDDPTITSILESALSRYTRTIRTAHSGRAGMQLIRSNRFDVVITDIIMPDFDGFEVIIEINTMQPKPRVIVITGGTARLSRGYLADVANGLSVQRVLYKPFPIEDLLDSVFLRERGSDAAR